MVETATSWNCQPYPLIADIIIGGSRTDRQTVKFNSPPNLIHRQI